MKDSDKVSSYFKAEWKSLLIVTITGLVYNVGLLAGPLFEGKLAQCLLDILRGKAFFRDMLYLATAYVVVITFVQIMRYLKRLYVRRFANNINRSMKQIIYGNLVHESKAELENENVGSMMTKAISDVEACAEGMRKFTTEVFDTGIALLGYVCLLLWYDWKLALLCLIFPPFAYVIAEKIKVVVHRTGAASKESAGRLNAATMDRVSGAITYRVFGCEEQRGQEYEKYLKDYEKKAVSANILVAALPPVYHVISMISVLFILHFGGKNVAGTGWSNWDIAAFTTFLACFAKLSVKSSKAAKLFNAVQKAQVSWKRIKPLMKAVSKEEEVPDMQADALEIRELGVQMTDGKDVFSGLNLRAEPGEYIGVTGPVACGKSTFGKVFLCEKPGGSEKSGKSEKPYKGSIQFGNKELLEYSENQRRGIVGYLGHAPELLSDSVENNVLLGLKKNGDKYLKMVCLDKEISEMPDGKNTVIGSGGVLLSGGQQKRLALARTLAHRKPVMILDDPFSALDKLTEQEIFGNLKAETKDSIVFLISHRLYLFPEMDQIIWMENGSVTVSDHEELMKTNALYRELYEVQIKNPYQSDAQEVPQKDGGFEAGVRLNKASFIREGGEAE